MFTGIVEEMGMVERVHKGPHSAVLTIQAKTILGDLKAGDSIAVNGVCLTATSLAAHYFTADVMPETWNRSTLIHLKAGSHVNLERAMPANGRFGGHLMAGHVDGQGRICGIRRDDTAVWYTVQTEPSILRYLIEKGSVALDGISLTVVNVALDRFSVSVIPHTVRVTTLSERSLGDAVNLEADLVGKYVERLMRSATIEPMKSTISKDFLAQCGY